MHAEYELNILYLNMVLEELWKPKLLQLRIQDDSRLDGFLIRNVCVQDIAWGGIKGHYAVDLVSVLASCIWATVKTPAILNMYSTDIGLWKLMEIVKNTR